MADLRHMLATQRRYFDHYERRLKEHFSDLQDVTVLELGAGTCGLSLLVKNALPHASVTALDISLERMRTNMAKAALLLGIDPDGVVLEEGDFSRLRERPNGSVDLLLFDAALHHARSIWDLLADCRTVLSQRGLFIAQREQFLGTFTAGVKLLRLLSTPEVKAGVSENAYLKQQYDYYLSANGFRAQFIPCAEDMWQQLLLPLNGLLLSKWIIIATPRA